MMIRLGRIETFGSSSQRVALYGIMRQLEN